ncbi:MAG: hypothetical protein FWC50_04275, partial [Planctomycetaceae bacterium]|nr:hypothetical protein [Planctomycetaceae bacterium]
MSTSSLQTRLHAVKRRWWFLGIATGLIGAMVMALLLLLLGGWLDLVWELSPAGRIGVLVASVLLGIAFFTVAIVRVRRNGRLALLARRVDQSMGFGGAVLTGCELEQTFLLKPVRNSRSWIRQALQRRALRKAEGYRPYRLRYMEKTVVLAHLAVEHAAELAATAIPAKAVSAKQARRSAIVLASVIGFVGLLALFLPEMMRTQWNRFVHPYSDIPRFSNTTIEIEDPEKRVVYGDPLDIRAAIRGEPVDLATLVLESASGSVETLPMFPEPDSHWRANLAKVTENAVYHIWANRARSTRHAIEVITVPRIENVRFRVTPPSYTHRPPYEGVLPKEGLSGLPGTNVEVWATSNRPLSHGEISVTMRTPADRETGTDNPVTKINLVPKAPGDAEVAGEFTITGNGKFELQLFDTGEQGSRDKVSGGITLLKDERPMV